MQHCVGREPSRGLRGASCECFGATLLQSIVRSHSWSPGYGEYFASLLSRWYPQSDEQINFKVECKIISDRLKEGSVDVLR